jgi:hypothetical protein
MTALEAIKTRLNAAYSKNDEFTAEFTATEVHREMERLIAAVEVMREGLEHYRFTMSGSLRGCTRFSYAAEAIAEADTILEGKK